jgi:hypothetical protein
MRVKGLLVEGNDGQEYLLGLGSRTAGKQKNRPTIWRRDQAGFVPLELTREGSSTVRGKLGIAVQPGETHDEHVKRAVLEVVGEFLKTFFEGARW